MPVNQEILFEQDQLEWCLSQMQAEPDKQTNYDHALMFAFLESHLASSNAKERSRVDEVLYQQLSDLAVCHEILVSIRLHRPQNKFRDIDEVVQSEDRVAWKAWRVPGYLTEEDSIKLGTLLLTDFYEAPLPTGKKNAAWLARSKDIRRALDKFWIGMRITPKVAFKQAGFYASEISASLDIISSNLTQEYMDAVEAEQQEILASIENARIPKTGLIQTEWGSSGITGNAAPLSKSKDKTRPIEETKALQEIDSDTANVVIGTPAELPTIKVSRRAYAMLTLMFPAAGSATTDIEWNNFVHAMNDLGFSARNGGGSAVVFENSERGERQTGGKIIFHKPHPDPKIDPIMLKSMGKRMSKWFGWHRDLFVLE
jgi:hypothetical protein